MLFWQCEGYLGNPFQDDRGNMFRLKKVSVGMCMVNSRKTGNKNKRKGHSSRKHLISVDDRTLHPLPARKHNTRKHGTTEGWPACSAISRRWFLFGSLGRSNSTARRDITSADVRDDPGYGQANHNREFHVEAGVVEILSEEQAQ